MHCGSSAQANNVRKGKYSRGSRPTMADLVGHIDTRSIDEVDVLYSWIAERPWWFGVHPYLTVSGCI